MKCAIAIRVLAAAMLVCAMSVAGAAHAASQRTFVGTTGTDNPNCTLAAPCRTFSAAINAVLDGGEVIVLDSGGYGPITITKSVSILASPGVYAGISVASGDGVTINGAGITVVLRGLSINGVGGNNGVTINDAATVRIEGCTISNLSGSGIYQTAGVLIVADTTVRNNAGVGIWSVGVVRASVDRVRAEQNLDGLRAQDGAEVVVHDSAMIRNAHVGAFAFSSGNASAELDVSRSLMSNNQQGAHARSITIAIAKVTLMDCTVTQNSSDGVLTTQASDGIAWVFMSRTTSRDNTLTDVTVTANTAVWLDASILGELYVASGAQLYTRDNNTASHPTVLGMLIHLGGF
jgi:hypothetical protein